MALIGRGAAVAIVVVVGLVLALIGGPSAGGSAQFQVDKLREKPEFVSFLWVDWNDQRPFLATSGIGVVATESGSNNRYEVSFYRWDDEGEPAWSSSIRDIDPSGFTAIKTGNFLVFGDSYASNLIAVSLPDGEVLSEYESNEDLYISHELTTQFLADGVITPGQVVVSEGRFTPRVLGVRRNRVVYCSYYGDENLRYNFKTEVEVVTDVGKPGLECDDSDMSIMLPNSGTVYVADDDEVFVYDSAKG